MTIKKVAIMVGIAAFATVSYFIYENIPKYRNFQIDNIKVRALIADTPGKRSVGLMGVKEMPDTQGLVAVFDHSAKYGVWMKGMVMPIDIIWLNDKYKIIDMKLNAQPCHVVSCEVFMPSTDARYVLELSGGWMTRHGVGYNTFLAPIN